MICPSCGTDNRLGASFCAKCGATLEEEVAPQPPESQPAAASPQPSDAAQMGGKVGLFGGHGLLTFGALIVLFAFMLPWASCSGVRLSGLDIVTSGSDYNGDASWSVLALVPLGALALLALGIIGIAVNLLGKKMPAGLTRLTPFLPLLATLPGLCGCCPSCAFFWNIQSARSDPNNFGLGTLIQIEYGFWLTMVGLAMSFVGMLIALVGGLIARPRGDSSQAQHT